MHLPTVEVILILYNISRLLLLDTIWRACNQLDVIQLTFSWIFNSQFWHSHMDLLQSAMGLSESIL